MVEKDPFISKRLTSGEITECFDPKAYTREVAAILKRVFRSTGIKNRKSAS
jgi:adenylosuccinate lyase